jgi:hypothetical protein
LRIEINATQLGEIASQSFSKTKSGPIGQVIASFQNSFYIRTREDELVFVTNRSLGSPVTVNLASNSNFEKLIPLNSNVTLREDQLLINDYVAIRLATAKPYKDPIEQLASKLTVNHNELGRVAFILGVLNINSSVLDTNGISHDQSGRFARNAAVPLREPAHHEQFVPEALKLVGLGTGFTPSGDDLLGGFLATWNSLAGVVGRSKILLNFELLINRTSWISAKLLDYMQRELLDSQVAHAIRSTALSDGEEFVLAVEALLPRGHTSGLDISMGMILATSLILDIENNTRLTETLLNQLGF